MVISGILLFGISQVQISSKPIEIDPIAESWKSACGSSFKNVKGGVLMDIPIEYGKGIEFKPELFDNFLIGVHRVAEFKPDRLLVYRDPSLEPMNMYRAQFKLVKLLAENSELVRKACTEGVLLSDCPENVQSAFLDFADTSNVRAGHSNGVPMIIRLYEQPVGFFTEPGTGRKTDTGLGSFENGTTSERAKAARLVATPRPPSNPLGDLLSRGLSPTTAPDLDFGDGQVLTLGTINGRLRSFKGCAITYDYRLRDQLLFAKGGFKAQDLQSYLKRIATAKVPEVASDLLDGFEANYDKLMKTASQHTELEAFYGVLSLTKEDYRDGKSMTVDELNRKVPSFKSSTRNMKLDGSGTVLLGSGLGLSIGGMRMHNGAGVGGTFRINRKQ